MRKIQIEFEIPEKYEDDYKDVHPELVFEDFFCKGCCGFKVIYDSAARQKELEMSLEYIREYYKVPAKKGKIVAYKGRLGIITGASGPHIMVRLEDEKHSHPYHPWDLKFNIEA